MLQPLDPAFVTLLAELGDRVADARLIEELPPGGTSELRTLSSRQYWYHRAYSRATRRDVTRYVGPASADLDARIARHAALKPDVQGRRRLVSALRRAGLPGPDPFAGEVLAALARAELFRLRACLVGTAAFQLYAGMLGVRLPGAAMRTEDIDVAQFHGIAVSIEDEVRPLLDALREVDRSFSPVPSLGSPTLSSTLSNDRGFWLELLTPHQGSGERAGELLPLPTIPGLGAQPLRFLDFLIRDEVRATVLYGPGITVNVPAPERYAVHKLIVATWRLRTSRPKALKDVAQASVLFQALSQARQGALTARVWQEACARGPARRRALGEGAARLDADGAEALRVTLAAAS
jgi:hypothetical protein